MGTILILILSGALLIDVCWEYVRKHIRDEWLREVHRRERWAQRFPR